MPLPIRRDYIRNRQSTTPVSDSVINIPRPVNAVEGDWIVAVISTGNAAHVLKTAAGWTTILYEVVNTRVMGVFARKYDEDDPATYPITIDASGTGSNIGIEVSSMAIGDAPDISSWVIGSRWKRPGSQQTTQSPSITVPDETLVLALEIEASNSVENDGDEIISGATKWFGSPNQTVVGGSIERVLVSYIEMPEAGATGTVTTTWLGSAANGAGIQIGIPYQESAPPTGEYVRDTFERTVAGGWGTTDTGASWTHGLNDSLLSVENGRAHIALPSGSTSSYGRLLSEVYDDIEMYVEWSVDAIPTIANVRPRFVTRYQAGRDYHIRASVTPSATTDFRWYRDDTAALGTTITLPRTYTPGDVLKIRMQTFPDGAGVTRLRARMWYGDEPEPTTWSLDIIDATPEYQAPGCIALYAGLGAGITGAVTVSFDNLIVAPRPPEATTSTGNIGLHVIPHFTQTSLRVGAKFLQDELINVVRIYDASNALVDTKTVTSITVLKWGYVDFTGLTPDAEYTIKFFVDSVEQTDASFTVRTLAAETSNFTVVAGSCQFTGSSHPVFTRIAEDAPAFIAHMGDLHYQDATDETSWRGAVESSLSSSTMGPMLEKVPFSWTWDNHDRIIVDTLNMGSTSPLTVPAWRELAGTTGWSSADTMGRSWTIGRVRFIQTDQWSVRDDPDLVAEPRTFLGAAQKQWWKDTLLASEEAVIVWFCQWTAQNHANGRWNSFNTEVTELENWLNAHPSVKERLILIGGDSHQLQADSGTRTRAQGSRFNGIPSLNVSGFNRSSTGANGGNWDIAEGDIRLVTDLESTWGAYSRLTFNDDGQNIDMLWEAVRVNPVGETDIMASWSRKTGTVTIDGKTAISQYYRADQSRIQPLSIEMPEA